MTDSGTPAGAPGGSPGGDTAGNTGAQGSFIRSRVAQMSAQTPPPAQGNEPGAGDAGRQQQQQQSQEAMVKFADGSEEKESNIRAWQAEHAEAASKRATMPSSPDAYEIKLPDDFVAPEGVRFEFDKADPLLQRARELAHKRGIDQATFSEMLGVYASTQMGAAIQNAQLRDVNMRQLGTAGPQRVEAVATWLHARGGPDGAKMANFIKQYPSAPIVKAMEALIRQFSSQGGSEYSGQHRAQQEDQGKIPGYENMSFVQRRSTQMQIRMQTDRDYRPRSAAR